MYEFTVYYASSRSTTHYSFITVIHHTVYQHNEYRNLSQMQGRLNDVNLNDIVACIN